MGLRRTELLIVAVICALITGLLLLAVDRVSAEECSKKEVCADFLCFSDFSPIELDLRRCDNDREQLAACIQGKSELEQENKFLKEENEHRKVIDELQEQRIKRLKDALDTEERIIKVQGEMIDKLKPNTFIETLKTIGSLVIGIFIGRGL